MDKKIIHKYSKEDDDVIRKYYPMGDYDTIREIIPEVSLNSIQHRASRLGVKINKDCIKRNHDIYNRRYWTDYEINYLKENYDKLPTDELAFNLGRSNDAIILQASKLKLQSFTQLNTHWKQDELNYISENWVAMSDEELANALGRTREAVKSKRNYLGLYRQDKNRSCYENMQKYLRGQLTTWKKESMISCNYCCVFTGSHNFQIHHKHSFSLILKEFIKVFPEYKEIDINDKNNKLLNEFTYKFLEFHAKYPLGVCVHVDIHNLYHSLYGSGYNTEGQWEIFEENFKKGKYTKLIDRTCDSV